MDLLRLEDDKNIWNFKDENDIPLYLMVRFQLLQGEINQGFDLSNPHIRSRIGFKDLVIYLYNILRFNPFRKYRSDVLIFSSGIVNSKNKSGFFYNRLYEYFLDVAFFKIAIIETSNKLKFDKPKKTSVLYRDGIDVLIRFLSILVPVSKSEKEKIAGFLDYVKNKSTTDISEVDKVLSKLVSKYKVGYFLYKILFKIKKPKLVVVEDGHYGGLSYMIKAARDLNIEVAEYQHGYIGLNHPAYNYNVDNLPTNILDFLPSYYLTHGEYWSHNCRSPAEKIEIGYPDLTEKVKQYVSYDPLANDNTEILFVSGGTVPDKLVDTITAFISLNSDCKIHIRPHPSERPDMHRRYKALLEKGVLLDTDDLYTTLSKIGVVVSFEVSTVLYEAAFFTQKIYLVDDDYANFYEPMSPFLRFNTADDLYHQIKLNHKMDIRTDMLWADNSVQRFSDFLQTILKD